MKPMNFSAQLENVMVADAVVFHEGITHTHTHLFHEGLLQSPHIHTHWLLYVTWLHALIMLPSSHGCRSVGHLVFIFSSESDEDILMYLMTCCTEISFFLSLHIFSLLSECCVIKRIL